MNIDIEITKVLEDFKNAQNMFDYATNGNQIDASMMLMDAATLRHKALKILAKECPEIHPKQIKEDFLTKILAGITYHIMRDKNFRRNLLWVKSKLLKK